MVTIYTSFGWGPCRAAKSWLAKNNISYTEKNVSQEGVAEEMFGLGYRSTPVIVTEKETIVGFNPTKLSKALL